MNARTAEEQIFNRKSYPLLYLVKKQPQTGNEKIIQSHSGVFYIMMTIVIFFSLGLLLNVGLKIQSVNYERKIFEINELISVEKERTDRLQLKISELKSPSRIIEAAENKLDMTLSGNLQFLKVSGSGINNQIMLYDYIAKNSQPEIQVYDNFFGIIYNIKDIVMVVSEGVLTFFIP